MIAVLSVTVSFTLLGTSTVIVVALRDGNVTVDPLGSCMLFSTMAGGPSRNLAWTPVDANKAAMRRLIVYIVFRWMLVLLEM